MEKDPYRLVLEIRNPKSPESRPKEEFSEVLLPQATKAVPQPDPRNPIIRAAAPKVKKIVVDAGHGGKDSGAIGRMGTKEKNINLLIALELAKVLRIEGGYEVLLTRTDDTFIPLHDRSLIANQAKADLFVSIHCNASIKKKEGGFEIYFLSEAPSDDHAEEIAEQENAVIELEGPDAKRKHEVRELLGALARTEFINESSLLCNTINRAVAKSGQVPSRGVKQADFHVLHGVEMPSVLVEIAFLTYAPEEQKVRKRRFRSAMVDAILAGIQNYETQLALLK